MDIPSFNNVVINSANLQHNYRLIRQLLGPHTDIMAMVKSDGYGHGVEFSAQAFGETGCTKFGVAELLEGVQLRNSGCTSEILIFLGFAPSATDFLFSHNLTPVVFLKDDIHTIATHAARLKKRTDIYLKFDCGMSRLGFKPDDAQDLVSLIEDLDYLDFKGIISHYPCSDDRASCNSERVFTQFLRIVESVGKEHIPVCSLCNSGGTLYLQNTHGEMTRVGISLYGYYPDGDEGRAAWQGEPLKPAMSFISRVLQVNEVSAGSGVSYGHTYRAERDMKLAVLPVGYSSGYPRLVSNRAEVIIRGKRVPIRGRICMNHCMADVSEVGNVEPGDEVVLLGSQGSETISADEIANWAETISYEILCSLGNNNQRVFK